MSDLTQTACLNGNKTAFLVSDVAFATYAKDDAGHCRLSSHFLQPMMRHQQAGTIMSALPAQTVAHI